jgi:hypothetical protein
MTYSCIATLLEADAMKLVRFVVGFFFFALGCSALVQIGSGEYFVDLPPNPNSAEVWGRALAATLTLGVGFIGLKMLASLLRREKQDGPVQRTGPMAGLRSFARKTIGFVLVLLATALLVGALQDLPQTGTAESTGYVIGGTILPLIIGYVGTKMMFRGDLPTTPSPAPTASRQ